MIQEILTLVVVEAIISDHTEMLFRNMDENFLQQFTAGFLDSYTFFSFMIIIIPDDLMSCFIKRSDSAFSHGRTGCIAHHVIDTAFDVLYQNLQMICQIWHRRRTLYHSFCMPCFYICQIQLCRIEKAVLLFHTARSCADL